VVLSNLYCCIGQGLYFRFAACQTYRHILDHRQPDAAQDSIAMGHRDRRYRLQDLIEIEDAMASLVEIGKTQHHAARVTPPDKAGE